MLGNIGLIIIWSAAIICWMIMAKVDKDLLLGYTIYLIIVLGLFTAVNLWIRVALP